MPKHLTVISFREWVVAVDVNQSHAIFIPLSNTRVLKGIINNKIGIKSPINIFSYFFPLTIFCFLFQVAISSEYLKRYLKKTTLCLKFRILSGLHKTEVLNIIVNFFLAMGLDYRFQIV